MAITYGNGLPGLDNIVLCVDAGNPKTYIAGNTTYTLSGGLSEASNGYFTFDGANDSINVQNQYLNTTYTGKTIIVAAWLDPDVIFTTSYYRAMIGGTGDRNVNFYIRTRGPNSNDYDLHFSTGPAGAYYGTLSSGITLNTQQWYIFAITQSSSNGAHNYYVNGSLVSTNPSTWYGYGANSTEYLGRADNFWKGRIGYWYVYSKGFSSSEIKTHYDLTKGRFGI
jgi:hypothetical protein